jgi:hypothetical protein
MTKSTLADGAAKRNGPDGHASVTRDVVEIVRDCSNSSARHGFRVVAKGVSGNIYFDRGRVIHAEFGEDCGLRAVVEMLRAGPVQLEPALSWPSQPSLHLGPELLLSLTGGDASRVVRKVNLPVEPPPLPEPQAMGLAEAPAPAPPEAARGGKRAISGVMPRVMVRPPRLGRAPGTAGAATTSAAPGIKAPPPSPPSQRAASGTAAMAMNRLAASVAESERSQARAAGLRSPPPPPVAARPRLETGAEGSLAASSPVPTASTDLPILRAKRVRSRAIVVAPAVQASSAPASSSEHTASAAVLAPAAPSPASVRPPLTEVAAAEPGARRASRLRLPSKAPAVSGEQHPTTMVRIAPRGELLAARGRNAEQLAEAAAFIHGLANLIAADFGRHGRANVHLSGGGMSLLVARSEVNDIAAALGLTERLASLLGKVGFK